MPKEVTSCHQPSTPMWDFAEVQAPKFTIIQPAHLTVFRKYSPTHWAQSRHTACTCTCVHAHIWTIRTQLRWCKQMFFHLHVFQQAVTCKLETQQGLRKQVKNFPRLLTPYRWFNLKLSPCSPSIPVYHPKCKQEGRLLVEGPSSYLWKRDETSWLHSRRPGRPWEVVLRWIE